MQTAAFHLSWDIIDSLYGQLILTNDARLLEWSRLRKARGEKL